MPTIDQAIIALERNYHRIERAKLELEAAQAEKKDLERTVLPPLFTAARAHTFALENGTVARKRMGVWGRFPDEGPKKDAAIEWLKKVGHEDAIKAKLEATWNKGDYPVALKAHEQLLRDKTCFTTLRESVNWATYQKIILDTVKSGEHIVPLDDINAEVYDEVTITKHGGTPIEGESK